MSAKIKSVCRKCRYFKEKLFLKGEKCFTKCVLDKRKSVKTKTTKESEYAKRLKEKQKTKLIAGLTERQFKNYFKKAQKMPGLTGENLLLLLEMRLDNVVRRSFVPSMRFARQLILHGFVKVNNKKIRIPGYRVKVNDKIELDPKIRENLVIKRWVEQFLQPPPWLDVNKETFESTVVAIPTREEMSYPVDESLIVELYSK
ncbi:MAG: 30S ribosomal protein S4 [Endomicrobiia bacterium]